MLPPMMSKHVRSQGSPLAVVILLGLFGMGAVSCSPGARLSQQQARDTAAVRAEGDGAPPFFGSRAFNFYGGGGTGQSITIELDGATTVEIHGVEQSTVEYRGPFANPLTLANGDRLLIDGDKIYLVDGDGQVITGCLGAEVPCVADLYEVTQAQIPDGLYILGGTDEGLEVSGDQYRYYSEGGEQPWQPVADLTVIQDGVIFDGRNYWCLNNQTEAGVCTENGWRTIAERLQEQAQAATDGVVTRQELSIAGFQIGDRPSDVNNSLGQPTQISQAYFSRYEYPGFTAWFDGDFLVDMLSTRPNYCTPSGVCPGMEVAEVQQIYGTAIVSDRENGQFMEYYVDGETCWLAMELDGERISSVAVRCQI